MAGCPKFQEIEINVTSSHIRICRVFDQGSQGFASQLSRLKPRKSMSVDLYVKECTSEPKILHRELKVIYECLRKFL